MATESTFFAAIKVSKEKLCSRITRLFIAKFNQPSYVNKISSIVNSEVCKKLGVRQKTIEKLKGKLCIYLIYNEHEIQQTLTLGTTDWVEAKHKAF